MYIVKMNYYADKRFNRPEFFITKEQLESIIKATKSDDSFIIY